MVMKEMYLWAMGCTPKFIQEFVRRSPLGKVTTNTVEGFYGVIKRQARNTNLFAGRSSKDAFLHDKLEELEFRFNIREKGDMFFVFLHALLHVYRPNLV